MSSYTTLTSLKIPSHPTETAVLELGSLRPGRSRSHFNIIHVTNKQEFPPFEGRLAVGSALSEDWGFSRSRLLKNEKVPTPTTFGVINNLGELNYSFAFRNSFCRKRST